MTTPSPAPGRQVPVLVETSVQPRRRRMAVAARLLGWRMLFAVGDRLAPVRAARAAAALWFTVPARVSAPVVPPPGGREFALSTPTGPVAGTVWGTGPVIYFVHGWGGRSMQVASFVPPLVARGFRVVSFDAPGHGRSAAGPRAARRSNAVQFARALGSVGDEYGPAHAVVAHSLGAIAAGVARRSGWLTTDRLVLLAPLTEVAGQLDSFARLLRLGPRVADRLPGEVAAHTGRTVSELTLAALIDPTPRSILLVHDRQDRFTPCEPTVALAQQWRQAELVVTTGLGHSRVLSDPDVVDRVVATLAEERPLVGDRGSDGPG